MSKTIIAKEKADFLTSVPLMSFAETTDNPTITANSYAWNNTYKALRINDSSTALKGSVEIPLGYLTIGDSVEITCEVMSISGVKPKVTVDFNANSMILQATESNKFERLNATFVIGSNASAKAVIGVFTADIGDFYIRDIEIKINHNGDRPGQSAYVKTIKQFNFLVSNGVPTLQTNYSYDSCTATVDSTNKEIVVTYTNPFTGDKVGTVYSTIAGAGDNPVAINRYIVKIRGESRLGANIRVIDPQTGQLVDPTTITYMWINLTHFGFDLA